MDDVSGLPYKKQRKTMIFDDKVYLYYIKDREERQFKIKNTRLHIYVGQKICAQLGWDFRTKVNIDLSGDNAHLIIYSAETPSNCYNLTTSGKSKKVSKLYLRIEPEMNFPEYLTVPVSFEVTGNKLIVTFPPMVPTVPAPAPISEEIKEDRTKEANRVTFIADEKQFESIKYIAYWDRRTIKDVMFDAIQDYVDKRRVGIKVDKLSEDFKLLKEELGLRKE